MQKVQKEPDFTKPFDSNESDAPDELDIRGSASIENYRILKTIGKGHYSK